MLLHVIISLLVLAVSAVAKNTVPTLTSADGSKKIYAQPIVVDGGKVVLRKASGKTLTAKLESFAEKDRAQLKRWMDAARKDHHAVLVKRVKAAGTLRVLFVGNSYSFKIPKQFEQLAKTNGKNVHVEQVTKGGWTFKKHSESGQTLGKIKSGKWDIVVLQEQSQVPSFVEQQRAPQMDAPAKNLVETVREAGAIPALFLTWGRRDGDKQNATVFPNDTRDAMQARLIQGYTKAAAYSGGAYIVPVGKIWSFTMKAAPDTPLYARDGSHPAKLGNTLGAAVFYTAFFNEAANLRDKEVEPFRRLLKGVLWQPLPYPLPE